MKKQLLAVFAAIVISTNAQAGIPTVNIPDLVIQISSWLGQYAQEAESLMNDIEQINAYYQQIQQFEKQIAQFDQQIQQYKQQYESITGIRGFGDLLNQLAFYQVVPQNTGQLYTQLSSGDLSGLSASAKAMRQKLKLYDCSKYSGGEADSCNKTFSKPAQDMDVTTKALDLNYQRYAAIEDLQTQINNTQDPKAIAELQARIAAEQAGIANEANRIQLLGQAQENQQRVQEAQYKTEALTRLDKKENTGFNVTWPSFSN